MIIEPKLMSAEDVAEYQRDSDIYREFAPQDIKDLLAHIAAQEQRIADLELRLQIATETNVADRVHIDALLDTMRRLENALEGILAIAYNDHRQEHLRKHAKKLLEGIK